MTDKFAIAQVSRFTARIGLLLITSATFAFALVSGSEAYGGGLEGILKNAPNALPWLLLLGLVVLAWKKELLGGILISAFGLGAVIFFNFIGPNFFIATFFMTLSILVLGLLFIISDRLRKS